MPLINQALPNLIGGVSQQPDVTRFDGQCEEQENALSSVVDGLSKRPQTKHVAEILSTAISANSFIHFIDRSATERYVYIQDGQDIHLFNTITGTRCAVGVPLSDLYANVQTDIVPLNKWDTSLTSTSIHERYDVSVATYFNATETQKINGDLYDIETVTPTSGNAYTAVSGFSRISSTKYLGRMSNLSPDVGYFKLDASNTLNEAGTWKGVTQDQDGSNLVVDNTATYGTGNYPVKTNTPFVYEYNTGSKTDFLSSSSHYLRQGNDPKANMKAISIGDTSLLLNTSVTVADNNTAITSVSDDLVLFIKQGDFKKEYGFTFLRDVDWRREINVTSGEHTDYANASTEQILRKIVTYEDPNNVTFGLRASRQGLKAAGFDPRSLAGDYVPATDAFTGTANHNTLAHVASNVIALKNLTYTADIQAIDGLGGEGMGVIYKAVDDITDLPLVCLNGMVIKIRGDVESGADDYYAKFVADNIEDEGFTLFASGGIEYVIANVGKGSWIETVGDVSSSGLNNTTMPYSLVNDNVNQFLLMPTDFETIQAGDLDTNPHPSFVGNKINNVFFYKDRLGFLSNDKVIMSEAGLGTVNASGFMSYNFYRKTVATSLDSDRIDVTVASSNVTSLQHAVGFQENLIMFSHNGQFVLRSSDLLTAKSVAITPITNFENNISVEPTVVGSYIYFTFNRGSSEGIREFTVNSTTDNYDANEITEHVPSYIPNDLSTIVGNSSEDIIMGFAPSTQNTLYVYKYFWGGTKKLLSSWSKFIFPFNVRGFEIIDGIASIVAVKEGKTQLLSMPLQSGLLDTGMNYNTYLDIRKEHTLSNTTSVPLGFTASDGDRVQVLDDEGQVLHDQTLTSTATSVTLATAHTGKVFSGIVYTMKYVFSEQVFKQPAGNSKAPSGFTRAQIRNGSLFFNNTRGFKVKVQPDNRTEVTNTFTPTLTQTSSAGNIELQSGNFRFPIFTDAAGTTITIENDTALPSNFSSAEFETFVNERSRRFG
tara:strand:+ start:9543 stop:12527 length:2985 start_codon:yes stop_codon:yes gene_type:complete